MAWFSKKLDTLNFDKSILNSIKNTHIRSVNDTKKCAEIIKELDNLVTNLEKEVQESVHYEQKIMSVYKSKCDSLTDIHLDLDKINEDILDLNRKVKSLTEEAHKFAKTEVLIHHDDTASDRNSYFISSISKLRDILKDMKSKFDDVDTKINKFQNSKSPLTDSEQKLLNELMSQKTNAMLKKSESAYAALEKLINDVDSEVKRVIKRGFINT